MKIKLLILFTAGALLHFGHPTVHPASAAEPGPLTKAVKQAVPDKVVVLTFDDAVSNHATFVAPLLKKLGFGASFYVCEFPPDFATNKQQYMTWEQIKSLHTLGFEVGNHTGHHRAVNQLNETELNAELEYIEKKCAENDIPRPTTFCYPGYATSAAALPVLQKRGYNFARAGFERAYRPDHDDPLLIPGFNAHGDKPDAFQKAVAQAKEGQIVVLTYHGVPEYTHPWVNTPQDTFVAEMQYLADNRFTVIALRDLEKFMDPARARELLKD